MSRTSRTSRQNKWDIYLHGQGRPLAPGRPPRYPGLVTPRLVGLSAILAVSLAALPSTPAAARPRPPGDPALTLTRVCLHEAGLDYGDDCAALYDALRTRAASRGYRWDDWARAYSPKIFDRRRNSPRRWIAWLPDDLMRPRHWPHGEVVWARSQPRIVNTYFRARNIVMGLERSRCVEAPDHWGGPVVDRNRIRAGVRSGYWRVVDCGDTANVFLRSRGAL